ncbi:MAG: cupin domain-containing protein [Bacteriovoracaceae bacterium]|nr:cupin domain-containing protein [Bacteriovoracaceae bacterium]
MEKAIKFELKEIAKYQDNGIVSTRILETKVGGVTIFAFDKGQRLSEHSAPFDAIVSVLEGNGVVVIDKKENSLTAGESIIMPADIPHAVIANEPFKMMLTMIRN